MRTVRPLAGGLALAALLVGSGCVGTRTASPPVVQPGSPGEDPRLLEGQDISGPGQHAYTEEDVAFMQGMMIHHHQAVVMVDLVPNRTENRSIRLLAQRIDISQRDEMAMMERWLESRGQSVPDTEAPHHGGAHVSGMPGMLTPEQLTALRQARGAEFDRLFLEYMVQHHRGALEMVERLFASDAGGQETEIWQFASHVDSDQRMEIERMQRMLGSLW